MKDPRLGLGARRSNRFGQTNQRRRQSKAMRRCLQQRRTLGRRDLSSRFLATSAAQASWRHVVEQKNASVNALVHVVPDDPSTVPEGPLSGMMIAVKDNICTKNMPTTCSSAMLRGKSSPRFCTRNETQPSTTIPQTFNHPSTRPPYAC